MKKHINVAQGSVTIGVFIPDALFAFMDRLHRSTATAGVCKISVFINSQSGDSEVNIIQDERAAISQCLGCRKFASGRVGDHIHQFFQGYDGEHIHDNSFPPACGGEGIS